jgi:hypothetical protein
MVSLRSLLTATTLLFASFSTSSPLASEDPVPTCQEQEYGIIYPKNGSTITLYDDNTLAPNYVSIVYCSGAYYKIHSVDGSVWLTKPGTYSNDVQSGDLLVHNQKPSTGVAYSSYTFNATIFPVDGTQYQRGEYVLSVYETTTGMHILFSSVA